MTSASTRVGNLLTDFCVTGAAAWYKQGSTRLASVVPLFLPSEPFVPIVHLLNISLTTLCVGVNPHPLMGYHNFFHWHWEGQSMKHQVHGHFVFQEQARSFVGGPFELGGGNASGSRKSETKMQQKVKSEGRHAFRPRLLWPLHWEEFIV